MIQNNYTTLHYIHVRRIQLWPRACCTATAVTAAASTATAATTTTTTRTRTRTRISSMLPGRSTASTPACGLCGSGPTRCVGWFVGSLVGLFVCVASAASTASDDGGADMVSLSLSLSIPLYLYLSHTHSHTFTIHKTSSARESPPGSPGRPKLRIITTNNSNNNKNEQGGGGGERQAPPSPTTQARRKQARRR